MVISEVSIFLFTLSLLRYFVSRVVQITREILQN